MNVTGVTEETEDRSTGWMVRRGMSGGTTASKTDTFLRNGRHDTTRAFFDQHLREFLIRTKRLIFDLETRSVLLRRFASNPIDM